MTVDVAPEDSILVNTIWFDTDNKLRRDKFIAVTLEVVDPPRRGPGD
jgi:hypothetical protein